MYKKEEKLGKDLRLKFEKTDLDLISVGKGVDLDLSTEGDLDLIEDKDNLLQAIICRLSTSEGELYEVGHADYGSRLHEIVGEINNAATRNRIKALIRECLLQEPRIKEIVRVNVVTDHRDPNRVNIEITVLPIESSTNLTITLPLSLEG